MTRCAELDAPLWREYLATLDDPDAVEDRYFGAFAIGHSPASADAGAQLVLSGTKTATSELALGRQPLPVPGQLSSVLDGRGTVVAIVETTSMTIRSFDEVGAEFARAYGEWEGERSLAAWRAAARDYYRARCAELGLEWHDRMTLACERFRVVYPKHTPGRVIATTERLQLRQFAPDDAEGFFALNAHPDAIRYTGDLPFPDVEAARRFVAAYHHYREHGFGRWSVFLRETGEYLGFCGLRHSPESGEVDLGFRIAPSHWGRGYATEAARAAIAVGFEDHGLRSLVARAMAANTASHRVLAKLGFVRTGVRTDDDGEWIVYALSCA